MKKKQNLLSTPVNAQANESLLDIIYDYIPSTEVANHLRVRNYKFSAYDKACIIGRSNQLSQKEKFSAYKQIMETMPDEPLTIPILKSFYDALKVEDEIFAKCVIDFISTSDNSFFGLLKYYMHNKLYFLDNFNEDTLFPSLPLMLPLPFRLGDIVCPCSEDNNNHVCVITSKDDKSIDYLMVFDNGVIRSPYSYHNKIDLYEYRSVALNEGYSYSKTADFLSAIVVVSLLPIEIIAEALNPQQKSISQ